MTIDYAKARHAMVEQQVRPWWVLDPRVLDVLGRLPREEFVPEAYRAVAYADLEIPLGHGQRMLKPVVVGRALHNLLVQDGEEVLEIGTGSGYVSACLGELGRDVLSLERVPELAEAARERLRALGVANVTVENADAFSWDTRRRFDAIFVTDAVDQVPARFLQWLKPDGRMFIVRGRAPVMEAVLVQPGEGGDVNASRTRSLFDTELGYLAGAEPAAEFQL
ncbi:protein-L-isoaspartate O-methyltransferase family protein [Luteimonas dalianensis]|uniref:protein-L-isoaspartate O-methyltransferase family protein n=1 Tax=Luteimonas dalianensis TaxID=1148196 RepID=UPI003BF2B4D9